MTEEHKEGGCCTPKSSSGCGCGCGCGKGVKFILMILVLAFDFVSGMWFARSHCPLAHMGQSTYCPLEK